MSKVTKKSTTEPVSKSNLQANIAGASSGGLLVLLANNIPDTYPIKSWLQILAPTLSVVMVWAIKKVDNYITTLEIKRINKELKNAVDEALSNPNLTPEDRAYFEKVNIDLDKDNIEKLRSKLKSIDIEDIKK